jgi:hypothetical protein
MDDDVKLSEPFVPDRFGYYWARPIFPEGEGNLDIVQVGWSDEHDSYRVFPFYAPHYGQKLTSWQIFKGPLRYE